VARVAGENARIVGVLLTPTLRPECEECGAMKMTGIPFGLTEWSIADAVEHGYSRGT
jgi:hypothetical protein